MWEAWECEIYIGAHKMGKAKLPYVAKVELRAIAVLRNAIYEFSYHLGSDRKKKKNPSLPLFYEGDKWKKILHI